MSINTEALIELAFRKLPIPGRYLNRAITSLHCDLNSIALPAIRADRWKELKVRITDPTDIIQRHIYFQGYFEYYESLFVRRTLNSGETFLDIGANIGWHALLAAKRVGASGRVIAFEPVSATYQQLRKNVEINGFNNVELHQIALGHESRVLNIYKCEEANCGANSLYSSESAEPPIEQVKVEVGDKYLNWAQIDRIHLCKIDVEGAELDVLTGLSETFSSRKIKKLMIEINGSALERAGRSADELIDWLRHRGFTLADLRTAREVRRPADLITGQNVVATLD